MSNETVNFGPFLESLTLFSWCLGIDISKDPEAIEIRQQAAEGGIYLEPDLSKPAITIAEKVQQDLERIGANHEQ